MAVRKPIVLVARVLQQLQAADTLSGPFAEMEQQNWTNGDAGSHTIGQVVYISAADTVKKAQANAAATVQAIGLATATIANGAVGAYQTAGTLAGLSGLTAGAVYYLDPSTAGATSVTAPSTVGQYVVRIGIAVSTTEMMIDIQEPILL